MIEMQMQLILLFEKLNFSLENLQKIFF